jgi:hypothetical protein
VDQKDGGLTELAGLANDATHSLAKTPEKRRFWASLDPAQVQIAERRPGNPSVGWAIVT